MSKYTDFWQRVIDTILERIDPVAEIMFDYPVDELVQLGERNSAGYNGKVFLWNGEVIKITDSAVFRSLSEVLKNIDTLKNKAPGFLRLRIYGNAVLKVHYTPITYELLIKQYKEIPDKRKREELYKWKLVRKFQDVWDNYNKGKTTFTEFFRQVDFGNLIYNVVPTVFAQVMKQNPGKFEELLLRLYNEENDLQNRIESYVEEFEKLYDSLAVHGKNTFQEERTIATLLTFRYPEKYTFYKGSLFSKLCQGLGIQMNPSGRKLLQYYSCIDDFVKTHLNQQQDLITEKNERLDESCYKDQNNLILAQDILYLTLDAKPQETETEKEIVELLPKSIVMKLPLNIILYGPPGTGKTYNSIDKAVEIITGKNRTHTENKIIFDDLKKTGQVEFVTFHQNYSYEDFIVGLKPDLESEELKFRPHKGIFYMLNKSARDNYIASKESRSIERDFDNVFNEIMQPLSVGREIEIKMKSGISYWIYDLTPSSILFRKQNGSTIHTLSIYSLKELVERARTKTPTGLESYYIPLVGLIQEKQKSDTNKGIETLKKYVLIIDEINRANISKVFGEMITLLEDDKRLGEPNELKITLPNKEKDFGIAPNLYIVGTMNTADKSIALVDIALRRRFEFIGYYPRYDIPDLNDSAINLLKHINKSVYKKKNSADYLIGHAYFLNKLPIEGILRNKVIPLLMEYFSGKTEIVSEIFAGSDWKVNYKEENYSWDIEKATKS
jgi:hypothetical protein